MTRRNVRGTIRFPSAADLPPGAKVRVSVIDVSTEDGQASVVAEKVLDGADAKATRGEPVPFDLDAELDPDPAASYAVSVHVDTSGDGRLKEGDFINMQRYPVSSGDDRAEIDVDVKKI